MKKIIIIIALFLIVWGISPKFIGGIVETEHQSVISKLNENPAISINSSKFSRNWFGGKAVTEMVILLQNEGVEDITIVIEENMVFGPIMFTDEGIHFGLSYSQTDFSFKDFIVDEEIETFIKDKIHLSGLITFSKALKTNIVIDEVTQEVDGNKVVSGKASGQFTLDNKNRIFGDFSWAGLTATTSEDNFSIEKVNLSLDQTIIAGDYYQGNAISTGDFDFSIASLSSLDSADNKVFTLEEMLMKVVSKVSDDLMTINVNYGADKIESLGQVLENANLEISFNGLNIKVVQDINELMSKLPTQGEEIFSTEVLQDLSAQIAKLLVDKPVIEIADMSVKTPEGKIESSMLATIDEKQFDTTNIMSIIPAITADANGKAPLSFFTKQGLKPMVDAYIEQGLVIQTEEELSFKVNFSSGQLNVNGKVIPL